MNLFDVSGKKITMKQEFSDGLFSLDLSDLSNGVYILNIQHGDVVETKKIIKN